MKTIEQLVQDAHDWNQIEGFEGAIQLASGKPDSLGFHAVEHIDEEAEEQTCFVTVKLLEEAFQGCQMMQVDGVKLEARGDLLARLLIL